MFILNLFRFKTWLFNLALVVLSVFPKLLTSQTYYTIGSNNYGGHHLNEDTQFLPKDFSYSKVQILVLRTELVAVGMSTNEVITGVQWYVETDNSSGTSTYDVYMYDDYSSSTLPSSANFTSSASFTKVGNSLTDVGTFTGWHTAAFTTNFTWDGFDNMVIQVCRTDGISSSSDQVGSYQGSSDIFVSGYNHNCSAATGYYTNTYRPYIRIRTNGTPLPVELTNFYLSCFAEKITFNWITATETNNDFFTIEESKEGQNWIEIAKIYGKGNSNSLSHYVYEHENVLEEYSYFRLKQTDFDGKFTYSDILSSNCVSNNERDSGNLLAHPNPSISVFNLFHSHFMLMDEIELSVTDIKGELLFKQKHHAKELSESHSIALNLTHLPQGIYFVYIQCKDELVCKKLVKL